VNSMAASAVLVEGATRLLLVEDEPTQQMLMERLLSGVGYAVDIASNGDDALEMIKTGKYQLVLTDPARGHSQLRGCQH
jgi:CheY-like chemotaxis protein